MATLGSPGVQVQVIDESFYNPASPGTVPLIFVATQQDKQNASNSGTAQGTLSSKTGDVWVITSQRDLIDTFGIPHFDTDASGNPVHASEINEYGLQAAYSLLGVSSKAYVVRSAVDLASISPAGTAPVGDPNGGQYWIKTTNCLFGINEWDSTTQTFTVKTPKIIDDTTADIYLDNSMVPLSSFGSKGDYVMVITMDNENALYYKNSSNTWEEVKEGFDTGKVLTISPHTSYPTYTGSTPTGSIWIKTTTPGQGANWDIELYSSATKQWSKVTSSLYSSTREALEKLDYAGGGTNIPTGTLFIETNYGHGAGTNEVSTFKVWRRTATGATNISFVASTTISGSGTDFSVRETLASSSTWSASKTVSISASTTTSVAALLPAAVSAAGLTNVSCTYDSATRVVTFTHKLGGDIEFLDGTGTPLTIVGMNTTSASNLYGAPEYDAYNYIGSNWKELSYVAQSTAPYTAPADGTLWFNSNYEVDILYHNGTTWKGYRDSTAFPNTDSLGPIVSATEPTQQVGGHGGNYSLVAGDIWISTADPERYGKDIYVYNGTSWILQDTTDNYSPNGWVFADARWATSGALEDASLIKDLLSSNYLDPDAPDPANYPKGVRLFNTRRSGNNVKKYVVGAINTRLTNGRYGNEAMTNYFADRWVSQSTTNADGSGKFGRHSQRGVVVEALKSTISSNIAIRDTDTLDLNLIACPGYPEVIQEMVALNADRGYTGFVVGDSPFRLAGNATALTAWGNNSAGALDNGEDGLISYDDYGCLGVFYPSGYTTNTAGDSIVVPPSHMILRTIVNSDAKSYPWFAPAGARRGGIDNATSVGYVDSNGEFKSVSLYESLRTVLHDVKINPIATIPGTGLVNFGQYTRYRAESALNRINVARLIAYLRRQLAILAKPYLFEPNDAQTRREIKAAADSLLLELVGQRALYDFVTVCDSSNNTRTRIDQNELWLDVAIEPVKAVEFIYIPLRIKKTGEIAAGA